MWIDTHCHLNHEQFSGHIIPAVDHARARGVGRMVVAGFDLPSSEEAVRLAGEFEGVYAMVGVHPHEAKDYTDELEARLMELAAGPKVVAIGEIGLDYYYDFSSPEQQRPVFERQLALAHKLDLPVCIHSREAMSETLDILKSFSGNCVMHCWTGTPEEAERALSQGLYLGFGGMLTFKNGDAIREAAARAPEDRLLVETDAPYLAPVPYRGKRCEPAYTALAGERLAELRGQTADEMARITTANALRAYPRLDERASR